MFQTYRRAIVDTLPLSTWAAGRACAVACCGKRWARGEGSSASRSRPRCWRWPARAPREGWGNVSLVQSSAEDARIAERADAALFCAVHDILRSPDALRNIIGSLRPGAWVAAGGGKWAPPLLPAVNAYVRSQHAPYVRTFD